MSPYTDQYQPTHQSVSHPYQTYKANPPKQKLQSLVQQSVPKYRNNVMSSSQMTNNEPNSCQTVSNNRLFVSNPTN